MTGGSPRLADPDEGVWPYLGVGCLTSVVGLAGGAMIAVLVAKVVGALTRCLPDAETGAPCGWTTYAMWGAIAGVLIVPTISIWRMRRGRVRPRDTV